jgi:hypothetical protein
MKHGAGEVIESKNTCAGREAIGRMFTEKGVDAVRINGKFK